MNRETVLLLPDVGKHISEIGRHEADEAAKQLIMVGDEGLEPPTSSV